MIRAFALGLLLRALLQLPQPPNPTAPCPHCNAPKDSTRQTCVHCLTPDPPRPTDNEGMGR